jgi:hypothetical protein
MDSGGQQDLEIAELLGRTRVRVSPAVYFLIGMRHEDWLRLLENPELSPRVDAPFMLLRDEHEVTLLLDEVDWRAMRHAARDARVEGDFRLVTLDLELDWKVVGYLARVTAILARAGISVGALSSFSRDHLLIKQDDLGNALRALGEHVAELC